MLLSFGDRMVASKIAKFVEAIRKAGKDLCRMLSCQVSKWLTDVGSLVPIEQ